MGAPVMISMTKDTSYFEDSAPTSMSTRCIQGKRTWTQQTIDPRGLDDTSNGTPDENDFSSPTVPDDRTTQGIETKKIYGSHRTLRITD